MYSVDLKNIVPKGGLTCLFAKATSDESELWHRRLGHINFKTMNKLVKGNLVRGLSSKLFENNQTCVACQKGKQHRASCKSKIVSSISQPLHMLHMDLFGLTFVKSLMKKMYCLVVTDDYSRFSWVFFLATKDDIIFGSTKKSLCTEFQKMMHKKFQMSSMGELAFFLGLTPMETQKLLLKDEDGEEVDVYLYISMIGSLVYLTSSRPDIMFAVCPCARYQVNPKVLHLHVVKRIFRYLKGQPKLGLWYPKDLPFDLVAYTDSDYAKVSLDRKSTTGGCQFLGSRLISWQCKK
ncbi:putative ribonuclease H-like domain-containing protein [Tanacetum coccineum]